MKPIGLTSCETVVVSRVIPHMDQLDRVLPYLAELGALHQRQGVARSGCNLTSTGLVKMDLKWPGEARVG